MPAWDDYIEKHSARVGVDPTWMRKIMRIESGGNASARTGSYKGLFQLSDREFRNNGGTGSIYDPEQNTMAAANKIAKERLSFKNLYKREPTLTDLYLIHQQGEGGYAAHMANPSAPAWQNMRSTGEGRQKGDAWAKAAIWGNLTPAAKAKFGTVENVTSMDFVNEWGVKVEGSGAANVSRGRPEVKWHRSRGEPSVEPEPAQKPTPKMPDWEPIQLPSMNIVAPEAPSFNLPKLRSV